MRVSNFEGNNEQERKLVVKLMESAFPKEERPSWERWWRRFGKTDIFNVDLIWDDDRFVGFITYWCFEKFLYIEHFAVSSEIRGGGWGGKIITHIQNLSSKPIICEVELPTTIEAQRRIRFYERYNMQVLNYDYRQPPYEEGYPEIEMLLMSNRKEEMEGLVEQVIGNLKQVYEKL